MATTTGPRQLPPGQRSSRGVFRAAAAGDRGRYTGLARCCTLSESWGWALWGWSPC
jgi:hypothetical protein